MPIPGACALINALIASGLSTKQFAFMGFLSTNKKLKNEQYEKIKNEEKTIIVYEAPHRITETLKELFKYLGDRNIVVAKEITKMHENFIRGTISEVINKIDSPKGEYIIVIEGEKKERKNILNELSIQEHYEYYEEQGLENKEIIKKIAKDRKVNKNEIYQKFLK